MLRGFFINFDYYISDGLDYVLGNTPSIPDEIHVDLNVDGGQVYKSTVSCIWPVLGRIHDVDSSTFIIGIYYGRSKPKCATEFLNFTIQELKDLMQYGYTDHNSFHHKFLLSKVICDAPARSFIKGTKHCTGYFGCDKCTIEGEYISGRIVFRGSGTDRTDETFRLRENEEHHIVTSPFETLYIDMINTFPMDYMHFLCHGVVKKCIQGLSNAALPYRVSSNTLDVINSLISSINLPGDFSRKPRSIRHSGLWKATEFRTFILYLLPVLRFCRTLHIEMFEHLHLLHCIITFSCHPKLHNLYASQINDFACQFISRCHDIWGPSFIVYNVHSLRHLASEIARHGSLDNFSCFWAENFLRFVKEQIKGSNFVLQQIVKRVYEKDVCLGHLKSLPCDDIFSHQKTEVIDGKSVFQKVSLPNRSTFISDTFPDNIVFINNKTVMRISNILKDNDGNGILRGRVYKTVETMYESPIHSSVLSAFYVEDLFIEEVCFCLNDIFCKGLLLECERVIAMPILHTII